MLVATKSGVVWLIKNGAVQPTPVIDISSHVNTYGDRGLLSLGVSRTFTTDHRLYLLYTYESNRAEPSNCKTGALSSGQFLRRCRHRLRDDHRRHEPGRGRCAFNDSGEPQGFTCGSDTAQGCLASEYWGHSVGDIRFTSDNTLYFSMGDASDYNTEDFPRAYRAQKPDSLNGKVMHVDRDGRGLATNPFWNGNPLSNRSRLSGQWASTPFRISLKGDQPYTANAGNVTWEEVNLAGKGLQQRLAVLRRRWLRHQPARTALRPQSHVPDPVRDEPHRPGAGLRLQPSRVHGCHFRPGVLYGYVLPGDVPGSGVLRRLRHHVMGTVQLNSPGTATVDYSIFGTGFRRWSISKIGPRMATPRPRPLQGSVERLTYGAVSCASDSGAATGPT